MRSPPRESAERWLVLTTDFRPMRGGIARMVGYVLDLAPPPVEWRCVTVAGGEAEVNVFRYGSFRSLCADLVGHIRWLRGSPARHVFCPHPYLQPAAVVAKILARADLTTVVYGTDIVPVRPVHRAALSMLRFSDRVVALSRFSRDKLVDVTGVPPDRISVIPAHFPAPWPISPRPRRRPPGQGLRLVTVSRLADIHKNIELGIRAASVLAHSGLVDSYRIVGDGPQRPALEELSHRLGSGGIVEFTGALDDDAVSVLLNECHVGLFPSRQVDNFFEGFGMIVHELGAAGLPVLVGASGGTPDATVAEWSIPVDPDDLAGLVAWIERLAGDEDLRHSLAVSAHQWALRADYLASARALARTISGSSPASPAGPSPA